MGWFFGRKKKTDVVTGGNALEAYLNNIGSPNSNLSSPREVVTWPTIYRLVPADLFTPGTQNWILQPPTEAPIRTIWGRAFLRVPNTFNPIQPPMLYSRPTITFNGLGGPIVGQLATQGLMKDPAAPVEQGS